jgi:hypothetical protein
MAAWQAVLLVLAAGGVAAGLFYLKVRPPRVNVASLLLWRRVLDQTRELTWWERFRRAVSLALTILVAVALALAIARPGPSAAAASRGRLLIVLDSSWSMTARVERGGTRWERAVAQARALAASAAGDPVALATTAHGLVEGPTTDTALIETTLGTLEPSGGEGTAWPRVGGTDRVHFFTDGAIARPLDADVIVHSVHEPAPNVAITAFSVRAPAGAGARAEAYLEVANYSADERDVRVVVTRGTAVILDESVTMTPDEAIRQVIPLDAAGDPRLRARVTAAGDALGIDDEAVAWFGEADPLDVTVVSANPGALALLLQRTPGVRAQFVAPAQYVPGAGDVVVFDRWAPEEPPARAALVLAPPPVAWLPGDRAPEGQPRWTSTSDHPVLGGVDPTTIDIDIARGVSAELDAIALSQAGTPLVGVAESATRRLVVVGFALEESNLAFSPAFPVLVMNALEWLARPVLTPARKPGPLLLPASVTRVVTPEGRALPLRPAGDRVLVTLPAPGLYLVESGPARSVVSVNVGEPEVSNLGRSHLDASTLAAAATDAPGGRPWWLYAVALAFVMAAVEWATWLRRITV